MKSVFDALVVGDDKRSELRSLLSDCIQETTVGKVVTLEDICEGMSKILHNGSVRTFLFNLYNTALLNASNMAVKIHNSLKTKNQH
jgi:hypothetical protein